MDKISFDIGVADGMNKVALNPTTVGSAFGKRIGNAVVAAGGLNAGAAHGADIGRRAAIALAAKRPGYNRYAEMPGFPSAAAEEARKIVQRLSKN